ncbi:hypothetical protein JNJ66_07650 [Candidatus Saccharibacteria bacterium]|nr:hypothetical protein [Candidatus Saccharibacteria bacterium]
MYQPSQEQIDEKIHSFLQGKSRDRLGDKVAKWILKPRGFRASDADELMSYEHLPWVRN